MKLKVFLSFLLFFAVKTVLAAPPVVLSRPVPAITASYNAGTTQTVVYTVTNYVKQALPLKVAGLSSPLSRTTVANDCGAACQQGVLHAI